MNCWLRPDGVREGIWRMARLLGDCSEGDASAGGGGGVSRAGESCGESSELMSMVLCLLWRFEKRELQQWRQCSSYPAQLLGDFSFALRVAFVIVVSLLGRRRVESEAGGTSPVRRHRTNVDWDYHNKLAVTAGEVERNEWL